MYSMDYSDYRHKKIASSRITPGNCYLDSDYYGFRFLAIGLVISYRLLDKFKVVDFKC